MTLSQRLALGTCVLVTCLAGAHWLLARARPAAERLSGSLAPVQPFGPAEVVGRIQPAQLGPGPIVAIAQTDSSVFLLQHQGWLKVDRAGVTGPFGAGARAGEGRILSGADIAASDSLVFVLDRMSSSVNVYTSAGRVVRRVPVRVGTAQRLAPERVIVLAGGRLIVSAYAGGRGRVLLAETGAERFEIIVTAAGSVFDAVIPLTTDSGQLLALETGTYRFSEVAADGGAVRAFERRGPPRVPLPEATRRSLERLARQLAAAGEAPQAAPRYLPAVSAAAATAPGVIAAAVPTALDSALVEEITTDGTPLRTLTRAPLPLPMGLSRSGVITLREEANATVVERRRWPQ